MTWKLSLQCTKGNFFKKVASSIPSPQKIPPGILVPMPIRNSAYCRNGEGMGSSAPIPFSWAIATVWLCNVYARLLIVTQSSPNGAGDGYGVGYTMEKEKKRIPLPWLLLRNYYLIGSSDFPRSLCFMWFWFSLEILRLVYKSIFKILNGFYLIWAFNFQKTAPSLIRVLKKFLRNWPCRVSKQAEFCADFKNV